LFEFLVYTFILLAIISLGVGVYQQIRDILKKQKPNAVTINMTVNGENIDTKTIMKNISDGFSKAGLKL
jgi:hypothetical protein